MTKEANNLKPLIKDIKDLERVFELMELYSIARLDLCDIEIERPKSAYVDPTSTSWSAGEPESANIKEEISPTSPESLEMKLHNLGSEI